MINSEQAWRCYNDDNELLELRTDFDMPPDMWRNDLVKRNADGVPIDQDGNVVAADGDFVIEHGKTGVVDMGINDFGNHYYKGIGLKVRILNFYNEQDQALTGWEFNHLTKPDFADGPTWDYTNTYHQQYSVYEDAYLNCLNVFQDELFPQAICDADMAIQSLKPDASGIYQSIFQVSGNNVPYNSNNKVDILSHAIPARTEPLGQQPVRKLSENNTPVEILGNPEMRGFTDSNQDHSAPFHGYISQISPKSTTPQRAKYWNTVLDVSLRLQDSELTGLKNNIASDLP